MIGTPSCAGTMTISLVSRPVGVEDLVGSRQPSRAPADEASVPAARASPSRPTALPGPHRVQIEHRLGEARRARPARRRWCSFIRPPNTVPWQPVVTTRRAVFCRAPMPARVLTAAAPTPVDGDQVDVVHRVDQALVAQVAEHEQFRLAPRVIASRARAGRRTRSTGARPGSRPRAGRRTRRGPAPARSGGAWARVVAMPRGPWTSANCGRAQRRLRPAGARHRARPPDRRTASSHGTGRRTTGWSARIALPRDTGPLVGGGSSRSPADDRAHVVLGDRDRREPGREILARSRDFTATWRATLLNAGDLAVGLASPPSAARHRPAHGWPARAAARRVSTPYSRPPCACRRRRRRCSAWPVGAHARHVLDVPGIQHADLSNIFSPRRASINAMSCGVVTITAPVSGTRWLSVSWMSPDARRHVDEQVVEVAPVGLAQQLLEGLGRHHAPDHQVVGLDRGSHRHHRPMVLQRLHRLLPSGALQCPSMPIMVGMLGP